MQDHLRGGMELALARYRLSFIHPFGTAHGLRDGTDSVFVRLGRKGVFGFGEATLPPYLPYTQDAVFEELSTVDLDRIDEIGPSLFSGLSAPSRAALSVAYNDLYYKEIGSSVSTGLFGWGDMSKWAPTMVTIGHSNRSDIALKLSELPRSSYVKVKLGSTDDRVTLQAINALDQRPLFLDANQGWGSVRQALEAIDMAGQQRVVGLEQPFAKDRWDLHAALRMQTDIPVYADESVQDRKDLERASEAFDGVNLKLMKCGGLDIAGAMALTARELGLKVMLGSMSESSVGCGAMAQLAGMADLLDLDGPWLINNDPFQGLRMVDGRLVVDGAMGIGVDLKLDAQLNWIHIGA